MAILDLISVAQIKKLNAGWLIHDMEIRMSENTFRSLRSQSRNSIDLKGKIQYVFGMPIVMDTECNSFEIGQRGEKKLPPAKRELSVRHYVHPGGVPVLLADDDNKDEVVYNGNKIRRT